MQNKIKLLPLIRTETIENREKWKTCICRVIYNRALLDCQGEINYGGKRNCKLKQYSIFQDCKKVKKTKSI